MDDKLLTVPLRKIESLPGFVVHWLLCGPFNADGKLTSCRAMKKDYLAGAGGEARVRPRQGLRVGRTGPAWEADATRHGCIVNLSRRYSTHGIVSYAAAYLKAPVACDANILLGSDDGFILYLNGRRIALRDVHRGLGVDTDIFEVKLKRGINAILLKVEQFYGAYEFCLRVTDRTGRAIPRLRACVDHPRVRRPVDPKRSRTISGYDYLSSKFATAPLRLAFRAQSATDYRAWRVRFLKKFRQLLGPLPTSGPLNPEVTEEVTINGFLRQRVLLDLEPGFAFPCYVTMPQRVPKGKRLAAVLCLHGHGAGKHNMVGSPSATHPDGDIHDDYAIALHAAAAGYVTISPDFLAFGERQGTKDVYGRNQDPCLAQFAWAQMSGVLPTAVNIATVKRCIDHLQTLPAVDGRRIAAIGHSFGGYMTTVATAVERRIKVAVVSGFMMTAAAYHGRIWTCGSQVIPGLLNVGDLADIGCTFAPRPTLIITGKYDSVTPFPFAEAAGQKIKNAYTVAGIPNRFEQHIFSGDHRFQPDAALAWLDKWL